MLNEPLVSVLMTAYNREKYIGEAIESVLASKYDNFELIIVDDASKDRTVEIAERYCSDARVRLHVNERNLGDYSNRNRAASLARGKYLKYLDSDDILYPRGLQIMVDSMEAFPEAGFGVSGPDTFDAPYPFQLSPQEAYRRHFLGKGLFTCSPLSVIVRSEAFRAVGGFSGKRHVGDTELWLTLGARYPVVRLSDGVAWWRKHEKQEVTYEENSPAYIAVRFSIAVAALTSPECPLCAQDGADALGRIRRNQARRIVRMAVVEGHLSAAYNLYRSSTGLQAGELIKCLF